MPLIRKHHRASASPLNQAVSKRSQSPPTAAPIQSDDEETPKNHPSKPIAQQYVEALRHTLHTDLDQEIDKRSSTETAKLMDITPLEPRNSQAHKVTLGGDLFVTIHTLTGLPKKLHMVYRKVFHCIVTCGLHCQSTNACHAHDHVVHFEQVLTFKYTGQPCISVELFDSSSRLHPFRSLGKADFILSQALLRGPGWQGDRELMDPKTNGKVRGVLNLSIMYTQA